MKKILFNWRIHTYLKRLLTPWKKWGRYFPITGEKYTAVPLWNFIQSDLNSIFKVSIYLDIIRYYHKSLRVKASRSCTHVNHAHACAEKPRRGEAALTKPVRFRFSRLSVADGEAAREPPASRRSEMIVARHHVFEMRASRAREIAAWRSWSRILRKVTRFGDISDIPRSSSSAIDTCIIFWKLQKKNEQINQ